MGWVRAVSDYTIGDLIVTTRVTAKSWHGIRPWVRLFLAGPGMITPSSIGEQTGQPALRGYPRSSFHTVLQGIYPMEACTRSLIA